MVGKCEKQNRQLFIPLVQTDRNINIIANPDQNCSYPGLSDHLMRVDDVFKKKGDLIILHSELLISNPCQCLLLSVV